MKSLNYIILFCLFFYACGSNENSEEKPAEKEVKEVKEPTIEYGFLLDTFQVIKGEVQEGMTLSHLLAPYHVSQGKINTTDLKAREQNLNYVTTGNKYTVLCGQNDTTKKALYFIYEKNLVEYYIFDYRDSVNVQLVRRPTDTVIKTVGGIIKKNSNLSLTLNNILKNNAVGGELAENIAQVYAWTIDFFKLYPEDKFKIIYEEKQVEGKPFGVGKIKAVYFWHIDTVYYAFRYQQGDEIGYFNEKGKGMKRPFLKAPLKFSVVTSGYTLKRFHPVDKVYRAHLGTDYAAPTGTPIMAVGDGTIEAATYSQYNGNYVKMKHSATYQTAYLHMSKIGEGIRPGVHVKQGDIIGYVGSTGLSTGPHVCFRFWKNGQQIDHRAEKFQSSEPIKEANKEDYMSKMSKTKAQLDSIEYTIPKVVTEKKSKKKTKKGKSK